MSNRRFSLPFVAFMASTLLLIGGQWTWGQENTPRRDGPVGHSAPAVVPDVKATLAKEVSRMRFTTMENLAATYASNRFGSWPNNTGQSLGEQKTAESTRQLEKKGWWGRNRRWVVFPALGVGAAILAVRQYEGRPQGFCWNR